MQIFTEDGQVCLFDLDLWSGKTSPEPSAQVYQRAKTSASSSKKLWESKKQEFMSLNLTPGAGNLLGESYWEMISLSPGESSTLNTGAWPNDVKESSLSQILEADPPTKYYLTPRACRGILRRASERKKELPELLQQALQMQAGLLPLDDETMRKTAIASFSAGAGKSAGGIGYSEIVTPTLKGSASGNCMPSVLCLNDQGGQRMDLNENLSGTLRAQEHGHAPLVYENHGIDARFTGPHKVAPTMSARYGTGGGNVPLVEQEPVFCIMGNAIDRQPQNGGNGIGYQKNLAYTLTATDHHTVCTSYQKTVGALCSGDEKGTGNQYVSQDKCIVDRMHLIRRLTPLERERLQGFPDGWTDIPAASDAARYKALGNSVAIPCVEFVLHGISVALRG